MSASFGTIVQTEIYFKLTMAVQTKTLSRKELNNSLPCGRVGVVRVSTPRCGGQATDSLGWFLEFLKL